MELQALRAELERLFELDDLLQMSERLLGFDPRAVGGEQAKGSFVKALTSHCLETHSLEALCDAVAATNPHASDQLRTTAHRGLRAPSLQPGERWGEFQIERKLGEGPLGIVYQAKQGERRVRLKLLHPASGYDARGLQRFLTQCRLLSSFDLPGFPRALSVGATEGLHFVVQQWLSGTTWAARLERSGPLHVAEAAPWIRSLLSSLSALHERHLVHGDLKLENVLIGNTDEGEGERLELLDAGSDRLRVALGENGHSSVLAVSNPKTIAPEVLRGEAPTVASDLYAVGAILYELLTQSPPFDGSSALEQASAHLGTEPVAPSEVTVGGSIPFELDAFVLRLLSREPSERPASAEATLASFESLLISRLGVGLSEEELSARLHALTNDPTDEDAALALEAAADEGGDPLRIAEAFQGAFRLLSGDDPRTNAARLDLALRSGRLFRRAGSFDRAEATYAALFQHDPLNPVVRAALEDLRSRMGKTDELIEMWLTQADVTESAAQKSELFAKIGALYERRGDPAAAVLAYTQAYCENPREREHAQALERVAGKNPVTWTEILTACAESAQPGLAPDEHIPLLIQMGHWYAERLERLDLALGCFQSVLASDAANDGALDGLAKIYKKAQQWRELGQLYLRRADAAATPERARALQAEAAEILDQRLNDAAAARTIYERILDEDPAHEVANTALAQSYQRSGDQAGYVRVLRRRAENSRGQERTSLLCKVAEAYESDLGATSEALAAYQSVVRDDPSNLSALRGLDRLYGKLGQPAALLETLEAQVRVAATPRQKVELFERIATLHEEEFFDLGKAAATLQTVLEIDPRHESAFTALERVYRSQQRWDELLELYGRHASAVDDPREKARVLYARATLLGERLDSPHQAIVAFEAVLEVQPEHGDALAALAELKQQSGDADEALRALDALAEGAAAPNTRADNYVRAARLLEKRRDLAGAAERYKLALDAVPHHTEASAGLRQTYVKLGNLNAAVELLQHQIEHTESPTARGKLTAELAKLAYERLHDREMAHQAATLALEWHDTSVDAREVLGNLALDFERFGEARDHLERLIPQLESLSAERATRVLVRFVEALIRNGESESALVPLQRLRELAATEPSALSRVAEVVFEHGAAELARDLYTEILERFDGQLSASERARATFHHAEATRRTGQLGLAVSLLEEAADLDPTAPEPLRSLARAYASLGDWEETWEAQSRLLDLLAGDDKVQLLIEMGELAMDKLQDRQRATRCLVAAVDVRPDDRRLLTRLMQLYSEDKDWAKTVDVVLKLADFVDDPAQRARYLMTAGMVSVRELGDYDSALACFELVTELDPSLHKALEESVAIHRDRGDYTAAEQLLKRKMKAASQAKDTVRLLEAFTALGELYRDHTDRLDDAIDAFEAAHTLDPENRQRLDELGALYASNPRHYFDKAVETYTNILDHDPYRADAYSALRKLYTETKNPDGAWLLCQALSVLKLAAPDEERFFKRMRSDDPAYAQDVLTPEDWSQDLLHPEQDPLLTDIFAIIEPVVIQSRGYEFMQLGFDPAYRVDLENHRYPIGQTLHYAAGVMDLHPPPCFENTNDPGGLAFLDTKIPSISMGVSVLNTHLPPQMLAFISGHHLSYYRSGHFLRQLVGTGTGLKSWLFAAIKLISPTFPLTPDLEGAVAEDVQTLRAGLSPQAKDELARAVSKLLQAATALDLKSWVTAVDYTADRVGLLLAHDLESALEVIQGGEAANAENAQRRLKEIVLFAISPGYLRLRERLGIHLSI